MSNHPESESDGPVVCPNCLAGNRVDEHFCHQCNTPLTSHAEIDPVGSIYAQGDTYRKAIANPVKPIVVIGMWLICGPTALICVGALLWMPVVFFSDRPRRASDVLAAIAGFIVVGAGAYVFGTMLFRVTRNFFRIRAAEKSSCFQQN